MATSVGTARGAEEIPSVIQIDASQLNPTVVNLGLLLGIFQGSQTNLTLNLGWFSNPMTSLEQIPSQSVPQLLQLVETLLGTATGNSLGTPTDVFNRQWYPIPNPTVTPAKPSGLYLVSNSVTDPNATIIGAGILEPFTEGSIVITPYAYLPILQMPAPEGHGPFILGTSNQPIELGVAITNAQGVSGTSEVSFSGLKVAVGVTGFIAKIRLSV